MHSTIDSFDFTAPVLDVPLIQDEWPVFDSILMYSFSPESTPSPFARQDPLPHALLSNAALAAMPIPPSRTSPRNKNPDHIPRPRNAFMLFRSAFAAAQKVSSTTEHDNRHITRIIAHCWNRLTDAEKQVWRDKAAAEKAQHAQRYPNYRFCPVGRANRPVKRNVRRNGVEDVKRCEKLAELVMAGKSGDELESAIKKIDGERLAAAHVVENPKDSEASDVAPFRSPLLPPPKITMQGKNATSQIVCTPAFYPGSSSDGLAESPCYEYYQTGSGVPPPPFQSMNFAQNSPNHTIYAWNQCGGFGYYH